MPKVFDPYRTVKGQKALKIVDFLTAVIYCKDLWLLDWLEKTCHRYSLMWGRDWNTGVPGYRVGFAWRNAYVDHCVSYPTRSEALIATVLEVSELYEEKQDEQDGHTDARLA